LAILNNLANFSVLDQLQTSEDKLTSILEQFFGDEKIQQVFFLER
jgi:hypothetical protein